MSTLVGYGVVVNHLGGINREKSLKISFWKKTIRLPLLMDDLCVFICDTPCVITAVVNRDIPYWDYSMYEWPSNLTTREK